MPTHQLLQHLHRESGRTLGDRIKGTPQDTFPHTPTQFHTGHPMDPNQFNIIHKEVNSQPRTIKEAMFICVQDPPQQKPRKVPTPTHLGSSTTGLTNTTVQANQPTSQHHSKLTPPTGPTCYIPSLHSPPTCTIAGGHTFFLFPYGKYTCMA